jgi:hypothetical protein
VKFMKRYLFLLFLILMIFCFSTVALAQFPFTFVPPSPFWYPLPFLTQPVSPFFPFPYIAPLGPFTIPGLAPRTALSLLSPIRMPQPFRQAAATITILFNPTQSVIQVTVLPITPTVAAAPVVAPTAVAPAIGPSALLLLPLLTALGGTTPQTQVNTIGSVPPVTPVTSAPTGLSALLPLI